MNKELPKIKTEVLRIINDRAPYNKDVWNAVYDYFKKLEAKNERRRKK